MFQALLALGIQTGVIYRVAIPSGQVDPVYDQAGACPDGIVVDDGVIYWTTMGTPRHDPTATGEAALDYSARDGGVHAVRADGTARRDILSTGAITTGKQLATDGAGTLYWGDREGCRISRVRTDGTGLTDLVVNGPGGAGLSECVGVAVDRVRHQLYWTQKGPSRGGQGRIFRAGLEIPAGESPSRRSDIELLWNHLPEPIDLELNGGWLYWTDRGAPPGGNTLNRAPLPAAGQPAAAPEILAGGFHEAIALAIDDDTAHAYVSDLAGHIHVVPLPGARKPGEPYVLATLDGPISGIAAAPPN